MSKPLHQLFPLPLSAFEAKGWLQSTLIHSLNGGFTGQLDKLVPDLFADDIYGADRLSKKSTRKDVGTATSGDDWEVQFFWWNSETQSNWWDGYARHILLLKDKKHQKKLLTYLSDKMATQDEDGYLGIYAEDLRYQHNSENGELWAQASLLRVLLACAQADETFGVDRKSVLKVVEAAVRRTMKAYPNPHTKPFKAKEPFAGLSHGLMFVDVLEQMYLLQSDQSYLDFAEYLLDDYNQHLVSEQDIQIKNLLDEDYYFQGHGVHTYEHLRALALVSFYRSHFGYSSQALKWHKALEAYLQKLSKVLCISGAPIGDEWISERLADADNTGYEYCSIHELLDSYCLLLRLSGDMQWAERIEWLLFNAAMGARTNDSKRICYCHTDNASKLTGQLDDKAENNPKEERFKLSSVHQDVAVCCVPNAGRIFPYFLQSAVMQDSQGLVLNQFVSHHCRHSWNEGVLSLEVEGSYPFDTAFTLKLSNSSQKPAMVKIRVPTWCEKLLIDGKTVSAHRKNSYSLVVMGNTETIRHDIRFETRTRILESSGTTPCLSLAYGPLLYVNPLQSKIKKGREYPLSGYGDHYLQADNPVEYAWKIGASFESKPVNESTVSWNQSPTLAAELFNTMSGEMESVELQPFGSTILRQAAFKVLTK